jgi:predicted CXXCH cytochrome family protein
MARRLPILLLLACGVAAAGGEGGRTPQPVIERAAAGTQCVADPATMRRNHMDLLRHQRDDTVRGGVRGQKFSLKDCIDCHASQKTGSVVAAGTNFCVSCHSYAAVSIDCFECHTGKPRALAQREAK